MKNKKVIIASALLFSLTGCDGNGDTLTDTTTEYETATAIENTTGQELTYRVIDGEAIFGGDIALGAHDDVQANGITLPSGTSQAYALGYSHRTWSKGIVPFTFSGATSRDSQNTAKLAMAAWESMTNIRFVERTTEDDYVQFDHSSALCASEVGRVGGMQKLNYNAGEGIANCVDHEIGHVLSLLHEQSRWDRNQYIDIHWDNMHDYIISEYDVIDFPVAVNIGDYNIKSIMHYGPRLGALNTSQPVFTPYDDSIDINTIGNASTPISEGDAEAVMHFHDDSEPAKYVHITKSNSTGYALDGGWGGERNQNVYIWSADNTNFNQMWEEIDHDNGYYSYRKRFTTFCMDAGNGGENNQNVFLRTCTDTRKNQQWKKTWKSGGSYQLIKRNAKGFAVNGQTNGSNGQNVNLYDSNNKSANMKWFITPIVDNVTSF